MEYTVKQLAVLSGVTARALRWYDAEGLLKPLRTTAAGYRIYGPAQVDRLQQILFYREVGMELAAIRTLLDRPDFDREAALRSHLVELEARRARLDGLILTVRKTMKSQKGEIVMSDEERFNAFKKETLAENERRYGAEIRTKYGAETVEEGNRKFEGLTGGQYGAMQALAAEIQTELECAVKRGDDPAGPAGKNIAQMHRRWLSYTWPKYSTQAHRGLGELYVSDERFTAYYDKAVSGCARFLRDAICAAWP